jgi:hypothetical protein
VSKAYHGNCVRILWLTGRFAALLACVALAGAALGACGGSGSGLSARGERATSTTGGGLVVANDPFASRIAMGQVVTSAPTHTVATNSEVCTPSSARATAGDPPPGDCLVEPASGGRYQCPTSVADSFGADASDADANVACRKVAPPKVPASWRPTLEELAAVKACLKRAGIVAVGGSLAGFQSHAGTPIGALMMQGGTRPTAIEFYASKAAASQAYHRTRANVLKERGRLVQHGSLLIDWNSLPPPTVQVAEEGCS